MYYTFVQYYRYVDWRSGTHERLRRAQRSQRLLCVHFTRIKMQPVTVRVLAPHGSHTEQQKNSQQPHESPHHPNPDNDHTSTLQHNKRRRMRNGVSAYICLEYMSSSSSKHRQRGRAQHTRWCEVKCNAYACALRCVCVPEYVREQARVCDSRMSHSATSYKTTRVL